MAAKFSRGVTIRLQPLAYLSKYCDRSIKQLVECPLKANISESDLILGPNIHWTSNYGTGIVFIGNILSWLSFHNFV